MLKRTLMKLGVIAIVSACLIGCSSKNEESKPIETTTDIVTEVETTTPPIETEKPTETITEAPVEAETTTPEIETTSPVETEAPTTKPVETEKPTEPDSSFQLSSNGYDFLEKWTDTLYITKNNDKYGVINSDGQTVIECKYTSIKFGNADRSELVLYDGTKSVVYNNNLKIVVEYNGNLGNYTNGMLMQYEYDSSDPNDPFPPMTFTVKNVYTGAILYKDSPISSPSEVNDFATISKNYLGLLIHSHNLVIY